MLLWGNIFIMQYFIDWIHNSTNVRDGLLTALGFVLSMVFAFLFRNYFFIKAWEMWIMITKGMILNYLTKCRSFKYGLSENFETFSEIFSNNCFWKVNYIDLRGASNNREITILFNLFSCSSNNFTCLIWIFWRNLLWGKQEIKNNLRRCFSKIYYIFN